MTDNQLNKANELNEKIHNIKSWINSFYNIKKDNKKQMQTHKHVIDIDINGYDILNNYPIFNDQDMQSIHEIIDKAVDRTINEERVNLNELQKEFELL